MDGAASEVAGDVVADASELKRLKRVGRGVSLCEELQGSDLQGKCGEVAPRRLVSMSCSCSG